MLLVIWGVYECFSANDAGGMFAGREHDILCGVSAYCPCCFAGMHGMG